MMEPPGTEIVPIHIKHDNRIAIPIWNMDNSIPVAYAMKKMATT